MLNGRIVRRDQAASLNHREYQAAYRAMVVGADDRGRAEPMSVSA